jgi:hypothetical protein
LKKGRSSAISFAQATKRMARIAPRPGNEEKQVSWYLRWKRCVGSPAQGDTAAPFLAL